MNFSGNVVIVTGAAKGIGEETALQFCRAVATVVLADIDGVGGELAAEDARSSGGAAQFVHCDVSSESDVLSLIRETVRLYGTIDILVNNAAVQSNKGILATTTEEFKRVMDVNITRTFLCTCETAKIINRSKERRRDGERGINLCGHGVARVSGISRIKRSSCILHAGGGSCPDAARHSRERGGTRNNGLPGPRRRSPRDTGDLATGLAGFLALQPLGRFGRPEEIAQVILMLAGSEASFVYGAVWMADGGYTIV